MKIERPFFLEKRVFLSGEAVRCPALGRLTGHPGGDEKTVRGVPGPAHQGQKTRQGAGRVGLGTSNGRN
jgi:hypothetical protein